jgi:hypothetical protein
MLPPLSPRRWATQPEDRLGDRFGWLQLRDPGPPHMSKCMWQAAPDDASRWLTQPDLRCKMASAARRGTASSTSRGGSLSSDSRAHVRCEPRPSAEPPPVRLRDSVESGGSVQRPSIDPPKPEYVMRAKGMATST